MNGRALLDTNIIIAIFANDASVINALAEANEVFVPSIALGELFIMVHINQATQKQI
jgi:tRNA(fMet)-specific endonuclease VapC